MNFPTMQEYVRGEEIPSSLNMHSHNHGHPHELDHDTLHDQRYLVASLLLILIFMCGEFIAGIAVHALVLIADAGHMLTDAAALGIAAFALQLAGKPATPTLTYGYKRMEILSAAINGVSLLMVSSLIAVEAVQRLLSPEKVNGIVVIAVASAGIVVNTGAVLLLRRANRESLNIAGAFTHILTDLWAFVAAICAGLLIIITHIMILDPIASLVVVVLMAKASWSLLRDSGRILLEGTPNGINLAKVKDHLLSEDHVRDVHDLHAWVVTSDLPALSAHIVIDDACFTDGHAPAILDALSSCLAGHFDLIHSTFQLETADQALSEHVVH